MQKRLLLLLFIASLNTVCYSKTKDQKAWTVNSPLRALVVYFPSPAVMRCLNHSDIPRKLRKAFVYRKAKFSSNEQIEQSVTVGVNKQKRGKFVFTGNISTKSEFIPMKVKGELSFGLLDQKFNFGLFGLENILGLQGKVHIRDKIGNQKIDYETFLKSTKGKIGDKKYTLELIGGERIVNDKLSYILTGSGMLGNYDISVSGRDIKKDSYEIIEKYGPVEIFTTVKVYD